MVYRQPYPREPEPKIGFKIKIMKIWKKFKQWSYTIYIIPTIFSILAIVGLPYSLNKLMDYQDQQYENYLNHYKSICAPNYFKEKSTEAYDLEKVTCEDENGNLIIKYVPKEK